MATNPLLQAGYLHAKGGGGAMATCPNCKAKLKVPMPAMKQAMPMSAVGVNPPMVSAAPPVNVGMPGAEPPSISALLGMSSRAPMSGPLPPGGNMRRRGR